ncbi:cobyrinate a,c-diamide synthase [Acidisphaera rubrifaciens]|uniref:Cobyrinate a,c-diamide synthase n=1 Tax=Acidisphaera rubrifaciens HS-AP3 TaxID=1231350 RepID=A0A0D6P4Z5_9PROT|nr:cobyrinate a,c-diamide synthase [Acidisphaera rubrifaciens]GAN76835.1 cobyrinic acid a,c-diamide synthase [Acidisphaera rubrifaciens HS-AP3]
MTRAVIIAAPASGTGKTTATLAVLAAFRRQGLRVRGAKSGPDYLDPGFHAAACGMTALNLDTWAMPPDTLGATLNAAASGADLLVIEGAMGLFDGAGTTPRRTGAAADLAALFDLPVILVLDVAGQMQSAAATAAGFARFDPAVRVAGVILNRVASPRHETGIRAGLAAVGMPVLGVLRRDAGLGLPSRHLGLVQAGEQTGLPGVLDRLAEAGGGFDLAAILAAAAPMTAPVGRVSPPRPLPPGQAIALARDEAFGFIYPHLLDAWRASGAVIRPFSPLADEGPDADCDVCWLPGGYPELHAGRIAANGRFRAAMHDFAARRPVHGECGGYMVLGQWLEDVQGTRHRMLGLLGHATSFRTRRLSLGYRTARLRAGGVLGAAGCVLRGHEFHYSTLAHRGDDAPLADLYDAACNALGPAGSRRGGVSGSYFHVIAAESDT